jgi:hypothetical protein
MNGWDEELLDRIEATRRANNTNWMAIVRLAMTHAPEECKSLLRAINNCDKSISRDMELLSK